MQTIADKLANAPLFSRLGNAALVGLLENAVQETGDAGARVGARPADVVIVLTGGLEMKNRDGRLLARINADSSTGDPGVLHTIPPGAVLTLTRHSDVLTVDGALLDQVLSDSHRNDSLGDLEDSIGRRVAVLVHAQPFAQMTLDEVCRCAAAMTRQTAAAGEEIVRYAGSGDFFYVIEEGEAEVLRPDARSGELVKVATLSPGASFGEEAILRGGLRNATVRMATAGVLLRLSVADFDRLLADHIVHEIEARSAHAMLARREAELIDCRYPDENKVWRIPGARLIPLDRIRAEARSLDKTRTYVVYCRTGNRSRAAAFLLRQQGVTALALRGGLAGWQHEWEGIEE